MLKTFRDHWRHLAKAEQERKAKLVVEEMRRAACMKKQGKCAERHSQVCCKYSCDTFYIVMFINIDILTLFT